MNITRVRKLVEFDTPTVANAVELLGVRDPSGGYAGPDLRALTPEFERRVGLAVTARMDTTSPGTDRPSMEPWKEMLRHIQALAHVDGSEPVPVIAVIEAVGPRPRATVVIGDIMAFMMKQAGAVGFLTNGSVRDIEGVRAVPLACWGYGFSPMHGRIRWLEVNGPVVIDGMTVRPGDVIHADVNGALVIAPEMAHQVYEQGLIVQENERKRLARLHEVGLEL
jgi:4-hydroxy-4-methyl-2-oxoglutarate aldolase